MSTGPIKLLCGKNVGGRPAGPSAEQCILVLILICMYVCMYVYIYIYIYIRCRPLPARLSSMYREFTKGGVVKGGLAIRHVFDFRISNGT